MTAVEWLLSGDTGISSETICMVMTGSRTPERWWSCDTPHDPSDFGRCYRLLLRFPEWRSRLPEVAQRLPKWGPMVEAWDELTALYERLCEPDGRYTTESYERNRQAAKTMYERMKKLNDEGMRAAGWKERSPGYWVNAKADGHAFEL
jgi:hypothetical protein